jgi:REP element-mobilizing transposase RayT
MLFHMGTKYELDRLVVMPNHVHAIVQFYPESDLSVVSQSWMRYTARQINQALGTSGPFWQPEPFDHIIRSPEQFRYLQQYILDNPAKAKLRPGEFLYWERAASNLPE